MGQICAMSHRNIWLGAFANNVKYVYICVPGHTVDSTGLIWNIYTDTVVPCAHELLAQMAYMWHLGSILVFGTYMTMQFFLSHDADCAINDSIAFLLLRWMFRGITWLFVSVLVMVLESLSCATDNAIGIMQCWWQWHHLAKKGHAAHHFDCLDLRNPMMPLMILLVSHDANANAADTWPKSDVAPHFDCLDLTDAMLLFIMLSALHDTVASANGIKWLKVMLHLISSVLMKGMLWCHFDALALCDANTVLMASHDPKAMLHLILIILTYKTKWCHS